MNDDGLGTCHTFATNPEFLHIEAREQNAPQVEQVYYEVERRSKLEVLCRLIDLHDFKCGIIFCSTKIMVDALADDLLTRGYSADRLHGDMSQAAREKTLNRFREKKVELLVATDVAGRGLDVDDVEVVFNFDLPNDAKDAGQNIRSSIGIWQWQNLGARQVYPKNLATNDITMVPLPVWAKR